MQRKEEAQAKRNQPGWKARRWVVEQITPGSIAFADCWSSSKRQEARVRPRQGSSLAFFRPDGVGQDAEAGDVGAASDFDQAAVPF
jgi:hypothetical protein